MHNLESTVNHALSDDVAIHSLVSSDDLRSAIFTALDAGLSEDSDLYHEAGLETDVRTCQTMQKVAGNLNIWNFIFGSI